MLQPGFDEPEHDAQVLQSVPGYGAVSEHPPMYLSPREERRLDIQSVSHRLTTFNVQQQQSVSVADRYVPDGKVHLIITCTSVLPKKWYI